MHFPTSKSVFHSTQINFLSTSGSDLSGVYCSWLNQGFSSKILVLVKSVHSETMDHGCENNGYSLHGTRRSFVLLFFTQLGSNFSPQLDSTYPEFTVHGKIKSFFSFGKTGSYKRAFAEDTLVEFWTQKLFVVMENSYKRSSDYCGSTVTYLMCYSVLQASTVSVDGAVVGEMRTGHTDARLSQCRQLRRGHPRLRAATRTEAETHPQR